MADKSEGEINGKWKLKKKLASDASSVIDFFFDTSSAFAELLDQLIFHPNGTVWRILAKKENGEKKTLLGETVNEPQTSKMCFFGEAAVKKTYL